jgi:hypothetical protein
VHGRIRAGIAVADFAGGIGLLFETPTMLGDEVAYTTYFDKVNTEANEVHDRV